MNEALDKKHELSMLMALFAGISTWNRPTQYSRIKYSPAAQKKGALHDRSNFKYRMRYRHALTEYVTERNLRVIAQREAKAKAKVTA